MGILLLLLLRFLETLRKPIIITSQTITITITFPLLLNLLLLLNQRNTTQAGYKINIQRPLLLPWYHTLPQTHSLNL